MTEERRKSRRKELHNSYPAAKKSVVVLHKTEDIKIYVKLSVGESSGKRPSEGAIILKWTVR